jgi:hypothetical protein
MQLCRTNYYFTISWLLNMFRAILSLETCWAVKEQRNNKLSYTVASCRSFLYDLYYDARIHEHLVKVTPRPFYSWGTIRLFAWNRKVGVSQSRRGRWGEEKKLFPLPRMGAQFLGTPSRIVVTVPTESNAGTIFTVQDSWVLATQ